MTEVAKSEISLMHSFRCLLALLFGSVIVLSTAMAAPSVRFPNGELTDSNLDIRVKVLGGFVSVQRTWTNGRWYFNPLWAGLKFKLDDANGEVTYVDRAGTVFERAGNGDVYVFDSNQFIRRVATSGEWRWYDRMGNYALYTQAGVLREYADKNGVKVSIESNAQGQPTLIKDHFDNPALTLSYVGEHLDRVTDRTGRFVQYTWQNGRLNQVRDVMGYTWSYGYDGNGQLTRVTDPESRETKLTYVQSFVAGEIAAPMGISFTGRPGRDFRISRVATLEDALGRITQYQYEYSRDRREFTAIEITPAPISRTIETTYDINGRLIQTLEGTAPSFERRPDGTLVDYVKNERGLVTRTERDSYRNVISVQHPDGTTESWKYLPAKSYITEYTDELGVRSTYTYDANGNMTETVEAADTDAERRIVYTYTQYGQLETRTVKGQTTADDAITSYVYDDYGNRNQTSDPESNVTTATYDVMGNVLTYTDARTNTYTLTYFPSGWLQSKTTPLGYRTEYEYDRVGNRTKEIVPVGENITAETVYTYDSLNRHTQTTDPLGATSTVVYDEEGRIIETIDARMVRTSAEYDVRSRLVKIIDATNSQSEIVYGSESDALEGLVARRTYPTFEELYKYDQRGRQVEIARVVEDETVYRVSKAFNAVGRSISETDSRGYTHHREYDDLRRVVKEVDPLGGETQYEYDHRDNLLSVITSGALQYSYRYDKLDRKIQQIRSSGQTSHYEYDQNGNLIKETDAVGNVHILDYDDDNRLIREEYFEPGGVVASKAVTYQYDDRGLLLAYMDSLTSARYSYDLRGALTSEEVTFGTGAASFTKKIERTYEANGLLKSLAYPDTLGTSQFIYNGNNQLAEYRLPSPGGNGGALVYQYDWNSVTQITMPGGVRREVTFDGLRRPIRIRLEGQQDTVLLDHQYTYLGAGLIQSKSSLDGIYQYDYDALGRVTKVLPPPPVVQSTENPQGLPIEEYTYDVFHNRLTSRHQPGPWLYNQDNELIEWGTNDDRRTLSYNDNGSVTLVESSDPNVPTRLYDYDTEGRMKSMREGASTTAEFSYNFMGQRISRRDSVGTTWFLYSQEGLIGEYDEQGNPIRLYGWLPGHKWGTDPVWQKDAGGFHLVHSDLESFPVLMTAATTGEKTWEARYTNFGDASAVGSWASDVRLRFPGQWIDGHIIQNGHREYDPETGRYLSQDPLGDRRNSYVYANQSPSNVTDSLGLVGLPRDGGTPLDWYLVQVFEENSHNKGDTIEVPERYCSYYMTEKMKRFARLAKERMEKDLDAGHSTAVAECSLLKFWTLAGERELNEHEVFALKNGFDGLIAHCTTVRTSSCCCGTSICAFSLRREDEFKDPLDHFPEGGPGEYEDRYNYVSLVKLDGGASTFLQRNWFRFTIECPTNLSWSKTSCK